MHPFALAFIGGVLIGLATSFFLLFKGRVFGVSGILGGLFKKEIEDIPWRLATLGGILAGGSLAALFFPHSFIIRPEEPLILILAGLLVGFGTQLGGGCTSGHGICGISRFSKRSFIATFTFMITGMITVFLISKGGF